jgi:hypothetical protein
VPRQEKSAIHLSEGEERIRLIDGAIDQRGLPAEVVAERETE